LLLPRARTARIPALSGRDRVRDYGQELFLQTWTRAATRPRRNGGRTRPVVGSTPSVHLCRPLRRGMAGLRPPLLAAISLPPPHIQGAPGAWFGQPNTRSGRNDRSSPHLQCHRPSDAIPIPERRGGLTDFAVLGGPPARPALRNPPSVDHGSSNRAPAMS